RVHSFSEHQMRNNIGSRIGRSSYVAVTLSVMILALLAGPGRRMAVFRTARAQADQKQAKASTAKGPWNVQDFGARGDGQADDTEAFQRALDESGRAGGGTVFAPKGSYRFAGRLNVPVGVTLKGTFESVPAHNGIRDRGLPRPGDLGTAFFVTSDQGRED